LDLSAAIGRSRRAFNSVTSVATKNQGRAYTVASENESQRSVRFRDVRNAVSRAWRPDFFQELRPPFADYALCVCDAPLKTGTTRAEEFFALLIVDNNSAKKFAAGFRFQGSIADAERVIGKWRSKFLEKNPDAKREKLHYEHHEIELIAATPFSLATVYARPWFSWRRT